MQTSTHDMIRDTVRKAYLAGVPEGADLGR